MSPHTPPKGGSPWRSTREWRCPPPGRDARWELPARPDKLTRAPRACHRFYQQLRDWFCFFEISPWQGVSLTKMQVNWRRQQSSSTTYPGVCCTLGRAWAERRRAVSPHPNPRRFPWKWVCTRGRKSGIPKHPWDGGLLQFLLRTQAANFVLRLWTRWMQRYLNGVALEAARRKQSWLTREPRSHVFSEKSSPSTLEALVTRRKPFLTKLTAPPI